MSQPEIKRKRCMGYLFHSQARLEAGKDPLCGGIRGSVQNFEPVLPRETIGREGFKYVCVGHSIFEKNGDQKNSRSKNMDTVEMPYCQGIEVIVAPEMMRGPATLNEGATGASTSPAVASQGNPNVQQRPGRAFVPGDTSGEPELDWQQLQERWLRSAKKIVARMEMNANLIGKSVKDALDRVMKDWKSND